MRVLGAAVLAFEAIVVLLAIPVVVVVGTVPVPPWLGITGGVTLALALVVLARYVTRPWAVPVGWVLQGLVVWALTPPFHLFSASSCRVVYFLLHFLFPPKRDLPVRKYGALYCPDFPPPQRIGAAIDRFAFAQRYKRKRDYFFTNVLTLV